MKNLLLATLSIFILQVSSIVYANELCPSAVPDRFVKDSYIVTFKPASDPENPLIWPVNEEQNRLNPPPFPDLTWQSKDELTKTLGINGQVTHILSLTNGAVIHMDAAEAAELRLDSRVLSVKQDQLLTIGFPEVPIKIPTCHPVMDEGLLTIPSIDTPDQLGKFQDIVLKPLSDGTWQLVEGTTIDTGTSYAPITKVKLITTNSVPRQVFLKISGSFPDECWSLGKVLHRLNGKAFEVNVFAHYAGGDGSGGCSISANSFTKTLALPVYGLRAGTYSYNVNGDDNFSGKFEFAVANVLPK